MDTKGEEEMNHYIKKVRDLEKLQDPREARRAKLRDDPILQKVLASLKAGIDETNKELKKRKKK